MILKKTYPFSFQKAVNELKRPKPSFLLGCEHLYVCHKIRYFNMKVYEYQLSFEESLKWTLEELQFSAHKCWCPQLSPHLKHSSFLELHDTAIKIFSKVSTKKPCLLISTFSCINHMHDRESKTSNFSASNGNINPTVWEISRKCLCLIKRKKCDVMHAHHPPQPPPPFLSSLISLTISCTVQSGVD